VKPKPPLDQLTLRQRECLRGVAHYRTYKEIARDLGISESMVEKHLRIARGKLGLDSTAEAARLYSITEGEEEPQSGFLNLSSDPDLTEREVVLHQAFPEQVGEVKDNSSGVSGSDHPLTAVQTLTLVGKVSIASIVGLLLLIACAEGLNTVLS
jgi:DNA-binding CsgD family transcriptional regulator